MQRNHDEFHFYYVERLHHYLEQLTTPYDALASRRGTCMPLADYQALTEEIKDIVKLQPDAVSGQNSDAIMSLTINAEDSDNFRENPASPFYQEIVLFLLANRPCHFFNAAEHLLPVSAPWIFCRFMKGLLNLYLMTTTTIPKWSPELAAHAAMSRTHRYAFTAFLSTHRRPASQPHRLPLELFCEVGSRFFEECEGFYTSTTFILPKWFFDAITYLFLKMQESTHFIAEVLRFMLVGLSTHPMIEKPDVSNPTHVMLGGYFDNPDNLINFCEALYQNDTCHAVGRATEQLRNMHEYDYRSSLYDREKAIFKLRLKKLTIVLHLSVFDILKKPEHREWLTTLLCASNDAMLLDVFSRFQSYAADASLPIDIEGITVELKKINQIKFERLGLAPAAATAAPVAPASATTPAPAAAPAPVAPVLPLSAPGPRLFDANAQAPAVSVVAAYLMEESASSCCRIL